MPRRRKAPTDAAMPSSTATEHEPLDSQRQQLKTAQSKSKSMPPKTQLPRGTAMQQLKHEQPDIYNADRCRTCSPRRRKLRAGTLEYLKKQKRARGTPIVNQNVKLNSPKRHRKAKKSSCKSENEDIPTNTAMPSPTATERDMASSKELLEFLTYVLQGAWRWYRAGPGNATERARSSGHATEQAINEEDLQDIVSDKISEWSRRRHITNVYDEPALLLNKRMWDVMSRNKEGLAKERTFIEWCRKVHSHTKSACTAYASTIIEHAEAASTASASTATEHAEAASMLKPAEHLNPFKLLAFDLLLNDLTGEERDYPELEISEEQVTGSKAFSTKQYSWINTILRKNLGDARVAYFIFNHGLPQLLDPPLGEKAPGKAMLQNMLEELMAWHASLLQSILERQNHPDMANERKLAALDQKMWQRHRRERKSEAKQQMVQGRRLVKERDSRKRNFEDMSAAEQQLLEDFETGRSAKRYKKECGRKMPFFRGKML